MEGYAVWMCAVFVLVVLGQTLAPRLCTWLALGLGQAGASDNPGMVYLPDPNACNAFLHNWASEYDATVPRLLLALEHLHVCNTMEDTYTGTTHNTVGTRPPPSDAYPHPRRANFTGVPTRGTAPLTVAFTDTSVGSPTSWSWTFGDGETSTAQSTSHIYNINTYNIIGQYTVSLTATNAQGTDNETKTNYITTAGTELNAVRNNLFYKGENDNGHVFRERNTSRRQSAVQYSFSTGDIPAQMSKEG